MTDKLIIFDTTLRDGEQSPGASMTREEKLRIARQLDRLRVDVIEAGFAASSNGDFEAVRNALEAAGFKAEVAEVTMRAENTIALGGEDAQRMQKLLDVLEDLDDVQDVFHNAELDL